MRALCRYHSWRRANTPRPRSNTQASHRQNWLLPLIVSNSSSTPLFAKIRHIPDKMPEKDAYEMAMRMRCLSSDFSAPSGVMDESVDWDLRSKRRGVCSVAATSSSSCCRRASVDVCELSIASMLVVGRRRRSDGSWQGERPASFLFSVNSLIWVCQSKS